MKIAKIKCNRKLNCIINFTEATWMALNKTQIFVCYKHEIYDKNKMSVSVSMNNILNVVFLNIEKQLLRLN